jgi:hypothetical protein
LRVKTTNTTPGWGNYKQARNYSGMSIRLLQDFVSSKLIRSSVVMKPGARRGVRLIDLRSLEKFIAAGVGKTSDIAMNATPATTGAANNSKGGQK